MNLENGRVILDSYRAIGLKDSDKQKLVEVTMKKESSFTATEEVNEPMIQDQPIVEVVPEIMPEAVQEEVPEVAPVQPDVAPVQETQPTIAPVTPEVVAQEPTPVAPAQTNLFDIPVQEPTPVVTPQPVVETPVQNEFVPNTIVNDEVQGGTQNTMSTELDTPQKFFEEVEKPANDVVLTKEMVEGNKAPSYMSEDPALIMLSNVMDVVKSKNEMIENQKAMIDALTQKVNNLEEAVKVSEAQRVAAETTLAQARSAEMPNNGPTLTYQQPVYQNQNYNQAA